MCNIIANIVTYCSTVLYNLIRIAHSTFYGKINTVLFFAFDFPTQRKKYYFLAVHDIHTIQCVIAHLSISSSEKACMNGKFDEIISNSSTLILPELSVS